MLTPAAPLLLPVAWLGFVAAGHAVAARFLRAPDHGGWDRALAAALAGVVVPIGIATALSWFGAVRAPAVVPATFLVIALGFLAAGRAGRRSSVGEIARAATLARAGAPSLAGAGVALAIVAMLLAACASFLLEPWAWDALGYHLPIVRAILSTGRSGVVPGPSAYLNSYPRAVELFTAWWRLLSPGDAMIELAQAPFALLGAIAIAAWARRLGSGSARAVLYAAVFVCLPIVYLQMAANYVDIAFASLFLTAAFFAFARPSWSAVLASALAFAAYVATKPSGPATFGLVVAALAVRTRSRDHAMKLGALTTVVVALGMGRYLENYLAFGNPIWPVRVSLGPLSFPGPDTMAELVQCGMPEAVKALSPVARVAASWTTVFTPYVYDMRLGGFGPVFTFLLLPLTGVVLARVRRLDKRAWVALVVLAPLATPGAFWSRYTIATAGALLAVVCAGTQSFSRAWRRRVDAALLVAALGGVVLATPGLTGGGPPLWTLASMDPGTRAAHVSADGAGREWEGARARVRPGGALAYDGSVNLVGQLWPASPGTRAVLVPPSVSGGDALDAWLVAEQVNVVVLGDATAGGARAREAPGRFRRLFACPLDPCTVYEVSLAGETFARALLETARRISASYAARRTRYAPPVRILLVEDSPRVTDVVVAALRTAGHSVSSAATCAAASDALDGASFDLAIIDVGLPDGSGLDVCARARKAGHDLPILLLTARNDVGDRVAGLDAGADDYLGKPFATSELAARVRALGRRGPRWSEASRSFGALTIDRERQRVTRDGARIPLTARELEIVALLAWRDGRVVAKDEILEIVWGETSESAAASLEVLVARVRRKLSLAGHEGAIRTVRQVGYAWQLERSKRD
jgi:DNA-binding response OmpR family regulator